MHEGKRIEQELYNQRVNISKLALMLGTTRKTIYDHFKREKADLNFIRDLKEKAKITVNLLDDSLLVKSASEISIPPNLQNKETDWQVAKLNEYIISLLKELLEAKNEIMKLREQLPTKQKKILADAAHPKKN